MAKNRRKTTGSGGRIRRSLKGRGPTPKAEDRPYHKAYHQKQEAKKRAAARPKRKSGSSADWVIGRNPVWEALSAGLPVKVAYLAEGADRDSRLSDILKFCAQNSIPMMQVTRGELDRLTGGLSHQGIALQLPSFEYTPFDQVVSDGMDATDSLVVALDGVTDPRNLGAIIRSAAAFGAQSIVLPERRSAEVNAAAWKTSAGAAARVKIAKVTNLNRALERFAKTGFTVIGLAGETEDDISATLGTDGPLVVVIGSEGKGLSRLVRENCDQLVRIPISSEIESLNASVAASIAFYEISRMRGR